MTKFIVGEDGQEYILETTYSLAGNGERIITGSDGQRYAIKATLSQAPLEEKSTNPQLTELSSLTLDEIKQQSAKIIDNMDKNQIAELIKKDGSYYSNNGEKQTIASKDMIVTVQDNQVQINTTMNQNIPNTVTELPLAVTQKAQGASLGKSQSTISKRKNK